MLRAHIDAAAAASVRPARAERFLAYGPNPVRILLIGSGIAVGHGVTTRARALDGRVGERIAEATGRGVIVNNTADELLRLSDQVLNAMVGGGFELEDIVIWCPSYNEMSERPWSVLWARQMRRLLGAIPEGRPLIICELPVPAGEDPAAAIAAPLIDGINRALRRVASGRPNTVVVSPPKVQVRPMGEPLFDAGYYEEAAAAIGEAALGSLGAGARRNAERTDLRGIQC
jgi:hypothetical protein